MTTANQAILALLVLAAVLALQVWLALRRGWFRNRLGGVYLKAKDTGEYLTTEPKVEDLWINSGISTIVPASEIIDVLMQPDLMDQRMSDVKKLTEYLDVPTASRSTAEGASPPATDANPNHLEDFTRLVDVAARKKPKD
jgi:hypothetical protein